MSIIRPHPLQNREDGFSMVELVIGIFIFGIVITGVLVSMTSSLNLTRQNRNRSIAANLASQEMDTVRSTEFVELPLGEVLTTQTIDGVPYIVKRETAWVTAGATSGACQTTSGTDPAYLSVDVSVTWNNMAGVKAPTANTVVTPPVGTYGANTGNVAVSIKNAAGLPVENMAVSLVQSGHTQSTTSDGCAFFGFENVGTYTVSVSGSGYVSDQGVATPTQSATVQAGGTTSIQFQYDRAATLNLTLAPTGGAALPVSPGVPVSLGNTHILPVRCESRRRHGYGPLDRIPVPVRRWLGDMGGFMLRCRPRGRQADGWALLRGWFQHGSDLGDSWRDEFRNGSHAGLDGADTDDPGCGSGGRRGDRHARRAERRHRRSEVHRPVRFTPWDDRCFREQDGGTAVREVDDLGSRHQHHGDHRRSARWRPRRRSRSHGEPRHGAVDPPTIEAVRAEDGVTLVELVTVVSLLGVVLGFVTGSMISIQNASVGESYRLQNLEEARILMDLDHRRTSEPRRACRRPVLPSTCQGYRRRDSGTPLRTWGTTKCGSTPI